MAESVGKYLKSVREEKVISIDMISQNTKINTSFIKQIEADNFREIGGVGYARAMIATIAKEIGADVNRAVSLFNQNHPPQTSNKVLPTIESKNKILISNHLLSIILIGFVVIVLGSIVFHFYRQGMLSNPFKERKTDKIAITENSIQEKKSDTIKDNEKEEDIKQEGESIELVTKPKVSSLSIEKAVKDTTDYLDNLLFENQKSPLNIELK